MQKKVALAIDKFLNHSTNWINEWESYCIENRVDYNIIDFYQSDILNLIENYTHALWHFNGYAPQDILFARSILYSASIRGIKTFPDFNTTWHFDDKVAEKYLLEAINAPMAKSWSFFDKESAIKWANNYENYPFVAKLRCGSGSNNVKLVENFNEAERYITQMFSKGISSFPSILLKATSNFRSATGWLQRFQRVKRIPEFIRGYRLTKNSPREKGYVFFQEFIPNKGYDIKIAVIGKKCGFLTRPVRKNDFRASGGGAVEYDKSLVPQNVIESAFKISEELNFQSMGYDFVVDERDGQGKIIEISYGFNNEAITSCNGYYKRDLSWKNHKFNPAKEVIKNLLNQ